MIWQVESRKDANREEWHIYLHDGSGKPEGRFYLCSALTVMEAHIVEAACAGTEAENAYEAYRIMSARLDERMFEAARP